MTHVFRLDPATLAPYGRTLEVADVSITMDEAVVKAVAAHHHFDPIAWQAAHNFAGAYDEMGNLRDVLAGVKKTALQWLFMYAQSLVPMLIEYDVDDVDAETLLDDALEAGALEAFEETYEEMADAFMEIVENDAHKEELRAMRQANRLRVEGGGYGFEGAAKGIAASMAINASTGMIVGAFNMAGRVMSWGFNKMKEANIRKRYRDDFAKGYYLAVWTINNAAFQVLRERAGYDIPDLGFLLAKEEAADKRFANAQIDGVSPGKKRSLAASAIALYPLDEEYYEALAGMLEAPEDRFAVVRFGLAYCPDLVSSQAFLEPMRARYRAALTSGDEAALRAADEALEGTVPADRRPELAAAMEPALLDLLAGKPPHEQRPLCDLACRSSVLRSDDLEKLRTRLALEWYGEAVFDALTSGGQAAYAHAARGATGELSAAVLDELRTALAQQFHQRLADLPMEARLEHALQLADDGLLRGTDASALVSGIQAHVKAAENQAAAAAEQRRMAEEARQRQLEAGAAVAQAAASRAASGPLPPAAPPPQPPTMAAAVPMAPAPQPQHLPLSLRDYLLADAITGLATGHFADGTAAGPESWRLRRDAWLQETISGMTYFGMAVLMSICMGLICLFGVGVPAIAVLGQPSQETVLIVLFPAFGIGFPVGYWLARRRMAQAWNYMRLAYTPERLAALAYTQHHLGQVPADQLGRAAKGTLVPANHHYQWWVSVALATCAIPVAGWVAAVVLVPAAVVMRNRQEATAKQLAEQVRMALNDANAGSPVGTMVG